MLSPGSPPADPRAKARQCCWWQSHREAEVGFRMQGAGLLEPLHMCIVAWRSDSRLWATRTSSRSPGPQDPPSNSAPVLRHRGVTAGQAFSRHAVTRRKSSHPSPQKHHQESEMLRWEVGVQHGESCCQNLSKQKNK